MTTRPDAFTERLSEYLDGELDAITRAHLEAHLPGCARCRQVLDELRHIVAAAPGYSGTAPARDLWPALAARRGEPEVIDLADVRRAPAPAPRERRVLRFSLPQLIAASLAMAVVGAGSAWLALGLDGAAVETAVTPAPTPAGGPDTVASPAATLPATYAEARYDAAVADLEQLVEEGRSRLDTATVRVIDESLRRIDDAIAGARAAIQRDPANAYLSHQIAANMRRKLNLLRAAAKAIAES